MENSVDKGSTVPTAIAFIAFVAIFGICFYFVKGNVNKDVETAKEKEAAEVGELANLKVFVDGRTYVAKSESTKATKSFIEHLPITMEMKDKEDGSKVGMVYFKFTTSAESFKEVEAGDILLSGDSEVIIVYKTHKVNDKYTKVAHIDNIAEISAGVVSARIGLEE